MEDYNQEEYRPDKSIKGYKILIIILVVFLGALSYQYFRQVKQIRTDFAIERDTLTNRLTGIISEMDNLSIENETITGNLLVERNKADSIMEKLQNERSMNRATIRKYEQELGVLRTVMQGYVKQIDSLNTLNQELAAQNIDYRKQVTSERLRADAAEEKANELTNKIRTGSVVRARDISLLALNANDREVSRSRNAERLRVDFVISANELTIPGERNVYARITGPDGYILANESRAVFDFEGDKLTYSATREIDYQNHDLNVGLYYYGSGITAGTYTVEIFMDGYLIGSAQRAIK